jgi:hypothetical protein
MIGGTSSQELTASATAIKPTPIKTARLDRRFRRRMPGPVNGDIVILAVYYPAVKDIIAQYADKLAGKIVVDITNPLNVETFDSLVVPADSSAAAELAAALPSSRVLKAFNTNFAATLGEKSVGPNPTTVLIAGDDVTPRLRSALRSGGRCGSDRRRRVEPGAGTRGPWLPTDQARVGRAGRLERRFCRRTLTGEWTNGLTPPGGDDATSVTASAVSR